MINKPSYLTSPQTAGKQPFRVHQSITVERVTEAVEREMSSLDNPGFCFECGEEAEGCEPDAREYRCDHCGAMRVYGAMEVLMCIAL